MIGKVQDLMSAAIVVGAASSAGDAKGSENVPKASALVPDAQGNAPDALDASKGGANAANVAYQKQQDEQRKQVDPMDESSVSFMTKELNELMRKINCSLEFKYNKEINMISVKMIDKKTQEVLKEFPPEEMIEHMVQAKDWIGAFLDKNA